MIKLITHLARGFNSTETPLDKDDEIELYKQLTLIDLVEIAQEDSTWRIPKLKDLKNRLKEDQASPLAVQRTLGIAKRLLPHFTSLQQAAQLTPQWKAQYDEAIVQGLL